MPIKSKLEITQYVNESASLGVSPGVRSSAASSPAGKVNYSTPVKGEESTERVFRSTLRGLPNLSPIHTLIPGGLLVAHHRSNAVAHLDDLYETTDVDGSTAAATGSVAGASSAADIFAGAEDYVAAADFTAKDDYIEGDNAEGDNAEGGSSSSYSSHSYLGYSSQSASSSQLSQQLDYLGYQDDTSVSGLSAFASGGASAGEGAGASASGKRRKNRRKPKRRTEGGRRIHRHLSSRPGECTAQTHAKARIVALSVLFKQAAGLALGKEWLVVESRGATSQGFKAKAPNQAAHRVSFLPNTNYIEGVSRDIARAHVKGDPLLTPKSEKSLRKLGMDSPLRAALHKSPDRALEILNDALYY